MKKLEPKQVPQFAALCILSAGTFGYFVVRLVTPSPAAAGTHPPVAMAAAVPATAAAPGKAGVPAVASTPAAGAAGTAAAPEDAPAPPPAATMRDPFAVGYVDPKTAPAQIVTAQIAPLPVPPVLPASKTTRAGGKPALQMAALPPAPIGVPAAPPLPTGLTDLRVRPAALAPLPTVRKAPAPPPPAPAWTVTGVLQGEAEQVAILRNGEARRIVRTGDAVDSVYKVVDVTRSAVFLRHGKTFYELALGGAKAAPVQSVPATLLKAVPVPAAPALLSLLPTPARHARRPAASLAQAGRSLIKMARSAVSPGEAALLPPVLEHARQPDRTQAALRFLNDAVPAAGDAPAAPPDTTSEIDKRQAVASSDAAAPAD